MPKVRGAPKAGSGRAAGEGQGAYRRETRVQWAARAGWGTWAGGRARREGAGRHPNRWARGSRSGAGASARSSCPCSSDTRTSVSSALPWPRSPAGSLLGDKGRQGQGSERRDSGTHILYPKLPPSREPLQSLGIRALRVDVSMLLLLASLPTGHLDLHTD